MKDVLLGLAVALSITSPAISADDSNSTSEYLNYQHWKRAVVHLEAITDGATIDDLSREQDRYKSGSINKEQYQKFLQENFSNVRYQGTAIYIASGDRRYLLTARHVLHDQGRVDQMIADAKRSVESHPDIMEDAIQRAKDASKDSIFHKIVRVRSIDEAVAFKGDTATSISTNTLSISRRSEYTFSNDGIDLAVISLNNKDSSGGEFKRELDDSGYEPISIDDIEDEPKAEGSDIATVGYPGVTSTVAQVAMDPAVAHWASDTISIPVFAFGKVAMLNKNLPFFLGNVSVHPGNSGGPVFQGKKLVGIVSAVKTSALEKSDLRAAIPFSVIIKASYARSLILDQSKKDDDRNGPRFRR